MRRPIGDGWRGGYASAAEHQPIRKCMTFSPSARGAWQLREHMRCHAAAYYEKLQAEYERRRDLILLN